MKKNNEYSGSLGLLEKEGTIPILRPFEQQYAILEAEIKGKRHLTIGTLGPDGTSSVQAVKYMIENLQVIEQCKFNIKLQKDFLEIFAQLENFQIDYALIPVAYEKVTNFFWHSDFSNILNFVFPTPFYGIVSKSTVDYRRLKTIRIATCPAVERLYQFFLEELALDIQVEIVTTRSTTEAILFLLENKADLAITNQTSFEIYKGEGIYFLSKKLNSNMVWSLFKNKNNKALIPLEV